MFHIANVELVSCCAREIFVRAELFGFYAIIAKQYVISACFITVFFNVESYPEDFLLEGEVFDELS